MISTFKAQHSYTSFKLSENITIHGDIEPKYSIDAGSFRNKTGMSGHLELFLGGGVPPLLKALGRPLEYDLIYHCNKYCLLGIFPISFYFKH